MYYQYFGLNEAPFSIAVNPRYLYMSPRHRDALAHLLYGVGAGGGFILLTGEVGTGKTTINRCLIEQLPDNADIAIVLNPALDARDMLATVCEELGIGFDADNPGLKDLSDALHRFLLANHSKGRKTVLMIDEAQHLSFDVLEQIRLLTNLETSDEKLLHIILIGQPELAMKLARPELRQLNQRITARFDLQPLTPDETAAYIRHRLHIAGLPAGRELFPRALVRAIHKESSGVPRVINLLCDRMLLGAYGRDSDRLDRELLKQAVDEVMGVAGAGSSPGGSPWRAPALIGSAILALALIAWLALPVVTTPETQVMNGASLPQSVPVPEDSTRTTAAEPSATAAEPPAVDVAEPEADPWRLSPEAGASALGALYGADKAMPVNPCAAELRDLQCEKRVVESWNQLLTEGRPALLGLLDEQRFEQRALLLAIDDKRALLRAPGGPQSIPLERLAPLWTGTVWQFWRLSPGVGRTLQRGDRGDDVARVAALFARLDGQIQPLTEMLFDPRLEARVKLFQQQQGLRADGVLGENTLRALSLAVGDDLGFAEARAWAAAQTGTSR
ncbi:ExeA family protein [Congregibacter litoralis]|uniref:Type II secretion system protein A n=1 Tax=Congregibacter litoralis KT71 TaxID=314285 RepID=A4A415_9GAMM|nr:ExeA family protein [Congregibacter litoralis]EAQ99438.1 type II secretion system protein A [Congregibacter litoralis KT71]